MNRKFIYLFIYLFIYSLNAFSTDFYDPNTKNLSLDTITVNGVQYNNVLLILNNFTITSIGSSSAVKINSTCQSPFTVAQYNAIKPGMTRTQVQQLLGCIEDNTGAQAQNGIQYVTNSWSYYNPTGYGKYLTLWVNFDYDNNYVQNPPHETGESYKYRSGF